VLFAGMLEGHRSHGGIVVAATHLPLPMEGAVELALGMRQSPVP
jgi:heme exporter protein A